MWRPIGLGLLGILLVALWVLNCSGPSPEVTGVQLVEPTADGAPYRVEATVQNQGAGHGEASVTVRLRDQATGWTVQQNVTIALQAHETTLVVVNLHAPRGRYTPEVDVEYPHR
jgi:hypothetical protein